MSLWGAASAVGAAAGPLVGGLLVDSTGWEGLFWIDAGDRRRVASRSRCARSRSRCDPTRPRSIDWFGTVLIATILAPLILAVSKGADWGWASPKVLVSLLVSVVSVYLFIAVEKRSPAPLVDLALMRNKVLIGATLGILIGAGTINGLMFVVSLYFQDPSTLAMSPLEAGLATLPATIGLVVSAPLVPKMAQRAGAATVVALGFAVTAIGFGVLAFTKSSWGYARVRDPVPRRRRRHVDDERSVLVGVDERRAGRAGRRRVGHLEHGALRGRRGVHRRRCRRVRRHDDQQGRRRRDARRRARRRVRARRDRDGDPVGARHPAGDGRQADAHPEARRRSTTPSPPPRTRTRCRGPTRLPSDSA